MARPIRRELVVIEIAALMLALIHFTGVLQVADEGIETGLMILGLAMSISVLEKSWRRLVPWIAAASILLALAVIAIGAGAPKVVPVALVALAVAGIVWGNPDTRRRWTESRWGRQPTDSAPM